MGGDRLPCIDCGLPGSALCRGCKRKRGTTTERGYGSRHQLARQQALATYDPDELCWRCGQTLGDDPSALALDHDETRSEYAGLVHLNPCNSGKRMPPGGWGESSERVGTPDPLHRKAHLHDLTLDFRGGPIHVPARKPIEQKRVTARSATKDSAGRPLPHPDNVRSLPGCGANLPDPPKQLGPEGRARWEWLWRNAAWLSPATDVAILVRLCEAEDLRVGMRAALADMGFWVEGSMGQMRPNPLIDKLRLLDDQITRYETACGLTPAARGALGVGEVKAEKSSPLDAILQQAATRRQA